MLQLEQFIVLNYRELLINSNSTVAYFHPPCAVSSNNNYFYSRRKKSVFNWLDLKKRKKNSANYFSTAQYSFTAFPIKQTYIIWTNGSKKKTPRRFLSVFKNKNHSTSTDITKIPGSIFPSEYNLFEGTTPNSNSNRVNLHTSPPSPQLKLINRRNDLPPCQLIQLSANSPARQKLASIE